MKADLDTRVLVWACGAVRHCQHSPQLPPPTKPPSGMGRTECCTCCTLQLETVDEHYICAIEVTRGLIMWVPASTSGLFTRRSQRAIVAEGQEHQSRNSGILTEQRIAIVAVLVQTFASVGQQPRNEFSRATGKRHAGKCPLDHAFFGIFLLAACPHATTSHCARASVPPRIRGNAMPCVSAADLQSR